MAVEIACLADIVRVHGARQPESAAIIYRGRTTSYGALEGCSSHVANALIAAGLRPQRRIAHLDQSSDQFFELLFGAAKANVVMGVGQLPYRATGSSPAMRAISMRVDCIKRCRAIRRGRS